MEPQHAIQEPVNVPSNEDVLALCASAETELLKMKQLLDEQTLYMKHGIVLTKQIRGLIDKSKSVRLHGRCARLQATGGGV